MELSLENLKEKEEKYNNIATKIANDIKKISKKVVDFRRAKHETKDENELARIEFEEVKIIEEITKLNNSLKNNQLIIEQISLEKNILLNKISKVEFANGIKANKMAKMLMSDRSFLSETEINIEKCEKAIKYYEIIGDVSNKTKWEKELENAKNDIEFARQQLEEDEKKQMIEKKDNEQVKNEEQVKTEIQHKKESQTNESVNKIENEKETKTIGNLTIVNEKTGDYELETRKLNGNEFIHSIKNFNDGSYIQKDRNLEVKNGITNPHDFSNFSTYEFKYDNNTHNHVESRLSPIVDENGVIIGEEHYTNTLNENKYQDKEHNIDKYGSTLHKYSKTMKTEHGFYEVEDNITTHNDETLYRDSKINIDNKDTGNKEFIHYTKENGRESYTYQKNGVIDKKITKTDKGTVIDIVNDGQPFETYEYDKDGNAVLKMGQMERIPDDYIEKLTFGEIPTGEYLYTKTPDEMFPEEQEKNNILESAVEATKETTRTSEISAEIENIQDIVKNKNIDENTKDTRRDDR